MADGLPELTRRLCDAGITLSATELADALWLAPWVSRAKLSAANGPGREDSSENEPPGRTPLASRHDRSPQEDRRDGPGTERVADGSRTAAGTTLLHAFTKGEAGARVESAHSQPVRVSAASALPSHLPLQQALRALRHYRPPVRTTPRELDEQATAERAAETGVVTPILCAERRQSAQVQLLMDSSSSMAPWEELCAELHQVCASSGTFRDVKVHRLYEDKETGALGVGSALLPAGLLRDPTGHRITLLLSDCAGPLWRSGRMQRELHHWVRAAPVAVVQPLPQRMWRRTHLSPQRGQLRRRGGLGGQLEFRSLTRGRTGGGMLPVPVLSATEAAFGGWARLVSGSSGVAMNAAVGLVHARYPESPAPRRQGASDTDALIRSFRKSASPDAVRLASYLSAAPLALPVMQLVQRAMLPHTTPAELAEVLLSGLLIRRSGHEGVEGGPWYEFHQDVRERFLETLSDGEALIVMKRCSQYVERHFGRRARNFPALAASYLSGTVGVGEPGKAPSTRHEPWPPGLQPFAQVSSDVLRRFLPEVPAGDGRTPPSRWTEVLDRANDYQDRYARLGAVRDLNAAVRMYRDLLRTAPGDVRYCTTLGMLAKALLRRWSAARRREDLAEAYTQARLGAAKLTAYEDRQRQGFRVTGVLGDVLREFAAEVQSVDDWRELAAVVEGLESSRFGEPHGRLMTAYELLRRADQVWGAVGEEAGADVLTAHRVRQARANLDMADLAAAMSGPEYADALGEVLDLLDIGVPADAYVRHLQAAVRLLLPLDGDARDFAVLALRGEAHLLLSQHRAGIGPVTAPQVKAGLAREHAAIAAEALDLAAARRGERGRMDEPEELAEHWQLTLLARWGAVEWAADEGKLSWVLEAAERAFALAVESGELERQFSVLRTRADVLREHAQATGGAASYVEAAAALRQARKLRAKGPPEYVELLAREGEMLMLNAELTRDGDTEGRSIRLLRQAVGETAPSATRATWLNCLGRALTVRYGRLRRPADRTEASTVFNEAARTADASLRTVSQARSQAAELLLMQVSRAEPTAQERSQAASLHQLAAEAAEEGGLLEDASTQLQLRAALLEQAGGPTAGAAAQRRVLLFWERHGQPDSKQARQAQAELDRLAGADDG